MKRIALSLILLITSFVSFAQIAPITGSPTVCIGMTTTLSDATTGGTWSSSPSVYATVGSSSGVVTGVASGVATITYTVGAGSVTYLVTVNPSPAAITGTSSVCDGYTVALSDATTGGTWSSSITTVAVVGSSSGVVTGITSGISMITYTLSTGCYRTLPFTVNVTPPPMSGSSTVCVGSTTTLTDGISGGMWISSAPVVASIDPVTGVLMGNATGPAMISYTLATGCYTTRTETVTPATATTYTVTGGGTYCAGGTGVTVNLTGSQTGVSYQLYNGVSTVGAPIAGTGSAITFGMMTAPGTYTVVAGPGTSCALTMAGSAIVAVNPLPVAYAITGGGSYCAGGPGVHIGLAGSDLGINYQLYDGGSPVGAPIAGTGASLDFGLYATAGTYTVIAVNPTTGCVNTMLGSVTVGVAPLPTVYTVTGGGSYCSGGPGVHVGLSGSSLGVNYQLMLGVVVVGSAMPGTGSALDLGLQTLAGAYTVVATDATTGCSDNMTGSATVAVLSTVTPSVSITTSPGTTICTGTAATFTAVPVNGGSSPAYQWKLNGVVITGATNSTFISSTLSTGDVVSTDMTSSAPCAIPTSVSSSVTITISVPTVTATASAPACGGVVTLTAGGASTYSWSPSTGLSCSGCGTPTTTPTSSVTYTVTGVDAYGCTGTATVTADGNTISGHITYTGVSTDVFKVWLIQFNPADSSIHALDSTSSCMDSGIPYFEFMDPTSGNYMVKAKLNGTIPGTSGYIPTYSSSTPNWYAAASVSHASSADVMNITMVYGTVPAGPGFISGYVVSGAGKGTADVPDEGMLIYLKDATTGAVITYTYTDATGLYSFNGIANGNYFIYPEEYKYYTTPSSVLNLNTTNEIINSVNFKKHTSYGTITPNATSILAVAASNEHPFCYPNPTNGVLNIALPAHNSEAADVTITGITGNVAYHTNLNVDTKQDQVQVDLSQIAGGMYFVKYTSGDIKFTEKLLIVK